MTKEELDQILNENTSLHEENVHLKSEVQHKDLVIQKLKHQLFGPKSEKFISDDLEQFIFNEIESEAPKAKQTDVYQDDTFDCKGRLQETMMRTEVSNLEIPFSVDNPNLHDDVDASFVANAPLLDDEAKIALVKALRECKLAQAP